MSADGNTLLPERPGIQFAGPDDARLVFSGPPQRLTGTIPLVNAGAAKEKLHRLPVISGTLQGPAQVPLESVPFSARLRPKEQAAVPAVISLDPSTRPGTYEIEVGVGDKTLPATVYVAEVVDFQVEPRRITILTDSAKSYTRRFLFQNLGNVDLPVGSRCEAAVFQSLNLITSLLTGLHKANQSSAEEMVKGFLTEWSQLQVGTMVITRESISLQPGQKLEMEVEFQLPPELQPFRHYAAFLQLYNATVFVDIYTTAEFGSPAEKKEQPARRTKNA